MLDVKDVKIERLRCTFYLKLHRKQMNIEKPLGSTVSLKIFSLESVLLLFSFAYQYVVLTSVENFSE